MTLTKMQARLALVAAIFTLAGGIVDLTRRFVERFAALDTRMAKLESAIKALDSAQPDERYRTLIKELMAEERENRSPLTGQSIQRFGGNSLPADAGASASSPAMVKPQ